MNTHNFNIILHNLNDIFFFIKLNLNGHVYWEEYIFNYLGRLKLFLTDKIVLSLLNLLEFFVRNAKHHASTKQWNKYEFLHKFQSNNIIKHTTWFLLMKITLKHDGLYNSNWTLFEIDLLCRQPKTTN